MSPNVEQLIAQVKALSLEDREQLWEALQSDMKAAEQMARIEAADRIQGKYRDLMSSTEEFLALKREEVELEDRRYSERLSRAATDAK